MDWFERITGFPEDDYASTKARLEVDGQFLISKVNGNRHRVGQLEVVTLQNLRAYPVEEELTITLKDGRVVMLRPAQSSDAQGIRELFHHLSEADVYTRFFRGVRGLSDIEVQRLCNLNYENEVAFVATTGSREEGQIVGQACYFINPTTNLGETAFMVHPEWQGCGLGSALQACMTNHAKRRGLRGFVADNREGIGTTVDHLASISTALNDRQGDVKQILHIAPTVFQNFMNIYQPAQSAVTGILAPVNFANTVEFVCSAIQAASRENYERSSKLCVQYLAPIVKNRQYNFPPLGVNPFAGASARPNELTYSEDRLRPDLPPPTNQPPPPAVSTDPAAGLPGLMIPAGTR